MEKMFKRIWILILCFLLAFLLISCGNDAAITSNVVAIPNIYNIDEDSAKTILYSNNLIPKVEYKYDDDTAEGYVIGTIPTRGTEVEINTPVTIHISKGSSYIESKDSRITWYNISMYGNDTWEFSSPHISKETLYIECYNVKFAKAITWNDRYQDGEIIGLAAINDTFDKTVPVSAIYEKQKWKANEAQSFTLRIPLTDLNENRPTTMCINLYAYDSNNDPIDIYISFSMTW